MVTFVNGFLCTSSCDVDKAKRNVNPHPKPGEETNGNTGKATSTDARSQGAGARATDQNAVVYGGSLATAITPGAASAASTPAAQQRSGVTQGQALGRNLDLLV